MISYKCKIPISATELNVHYKVRLRPAGFGPCRDGCDLLGHRHQHAQNSRSQGNQKKYALRKGRNFQCAWL